ncbi:MAG: hypothetical protein ACTSWQ_01530 [Candidatus Thorarchaeota archaeon]
MFDINIEEKTAKKGKGSLDLNDLDRGLSRLACNNVHSAITENSVVIDICNATLRAYSKKATSVKRIPERIRVILLNAIRNSLYENNRANKKSRDEIGLGNKCLFWKWGELTRLQKIFESKE